MPIGKIIKVGLKVLKKKKKPPLVGPITKIQNINKKVDKLKVEKRKASKAIGRKYKTDTERKRSIKGAKINIKNIDEHINRLKLQSRDLSKRSNDYNLRKK